MGEGQAWLPLRLAVRGRKIRLSGGKRRPNPQSFSWQEQLWKRSGSIKGAKCTWRGCSFGAGTHFVRSCCR